MTDPVSTTRRREYEDATGGYCAADGTERYASGPDSAATKTAKPPAPNASKPLEASAKQLVDQRTKASTQLQIAAMAKQSGRTELAGGVGSYEKGEGRLSAVEGKLPLFGGDAKASLVSVKGVASTAAYDGSQGASAGAGVSLASIEWSYARGHESMSVGVDVGLSAGVSIGTRDANGNGIPETCWSVDAGLSIAACKEDDVPPQADGPTNGTSGTGGRTRDGGSGGASGW